MQVEVLKSLCLAQGASVCIPRMLEQVAAGFPSPAADYVEDTLDLNQHLVQHPAATFIVRAGGWSMRDAGIYPGDELVVDRALHAEAGDIVIALVNGTQSTVKRLMFAADGRLWLKAENPEYADIIPQNDETVEIWGVVTASIRLFKRRRKSSDVRI